jgi:acetamidase/formamidase
VESAEIGDVLEVRVLAAKLAIAYAYNGFGPGRGYLPDDYPYPKTKIIPLDEKRMVAKFAAGIEIPLHPFFGSMGVAPPETSGRLSSALDSGGQSGRQRPGGREHTVYPGARAGSAV